MTTTHQAPDHFPRTPLMTRPMTHRLLTPPLPINQRDPNCPPGRYRTPPIFPNLLLIIHPRKSTRAAECSLFHPLPPQRQAPCLTKIRICNPQARFPIMLALPQPLLSMFEIFLAPGNLQLFQAKPFRHRFDPFDLLHQFPHCLPSM